MGLVLLYTLMLQSLVILYFSIAMLPSLHRTCLIIDSENRSVSKDLLGLSNTAYVTVICNALNC